MRAAYESRRSLEAAAHFAGQKGRERNTPNKEPINFGRRASRRARVTSSGASLESEREPAACWLARAVSDAACASGEPEARCCADMLI